MSIVETIKEHPLPVIGGVLVLVLLMSRSGGGDSGAAGSIAASLQSQAIASETNAALSAINADVTKATTAAQTAMYVEGVTAAAEVARARAASDASLFATLAMSGDSQLQTLTGGKVALAGIQAGMFKDAGEQAVAMATIQAGQRVALDTNATQIKALQESYAGQSVLARIASALGIETTRLQTGAATLQSQIAADSAAQLAHIGYVRDIDLQKISGAQTEALARIGYDQSTTLARIGFDQSTALARIGFDQSTALANIESRSALDQIRESMAGAIGLMTAKGEYDLGIARLNTETDRYVADLQASVTNKQTSASKSNNLIKTIGGLVGSIFSDAKLKENIAFTGKYTAAGQRIYEWNYRGTPEQRYEGVMASESPDRAVRNVGPYQAVDMGAIL